MTTDSDQWMSDQHAIAAAFVPTLRHRDSGLERNSDIEHAKYELKQAHLNSRRAFSYNTSSEFRLSGVVQRALGWKESDLLDFLTKEPVQRTGISSNQVDYDVLHFKSDTVDEMHHRRVAGHDIVQALQKLTVAEMEIVKHGYAITYAIADAQLILLMDHLRQPGISMTILHHPSDFHAQHPQEYDNPYFVRKVTNDAIIKAWQSLTSNFMSFGLLKQGEAYEPKPLEYRPADGSPKRRTDRTFIALAWFTDVVKDGKLCFDTKITCRELSLGEDRTQLCELGLCRDPE